MRVGFFPPSFPHPCVLDAARVKEGPRGCGQLCEMWAFLISWFKFPLKILVSGRKRVPDPFAVFWVNGIPRDGTG